MVTEQSEVIHTIISISLLLFTAKIFSEIFYRINVPVVVGQLLAGIIIGPFAIGGLLLLDDKPLVTVNETVKQFGEVAAIIILFIAGLEITPREFFKKGVSSFIVGGLGVLVPFVMGYYIFSFLGLTNLESIMIATALTATSIAISVAVLRELKKLKSVEGRLILGAAIIDDILAIAVLSAVTTVASKDITNVSITNIIFLFLETLGLFVVMIVVTSLLVPKILKKERFLKSEYSFEGFITASFFGAAGIAAIIGLSPIVGAFAIGMAVSSTHLLKRVEEYVEKLGIIFVPLFFAIIGAQVDLQAINPYVIYLSLIMLLVAITI